jgi:hypothetical protein
VKNILKEEILRIPPTFSGFDSKAFETFPDCQHLKSHFQKNSTGKEYTIRKAHSTKNSTTITQISLQCQVADLYKTENTG